METKEVSSLYGTVFEDEFKDHATWTEELRQCRSLTGEMGDANWL